MIRAALVAVLLGAPALVDAQEVPEPDGYRMERYRAPVPETLDGARVVDAGGAHALWQSGAAAFIDVMPHAPKPDNLPDGTIWYDTPRQSIPGALWLPNVGYGGIALQTEEYFRNGLARATGEDTDHPVLIFCLAECWMSWNAAKRALAFGYTRVIWMPGGTDSWQASGFPTEAVTPAAVP